MNRCGNPADACADPSDGKGLARSRFRPLYESSIPTSDPWECAQSELNVGIIAEALGVSVMWLVYGDDQSNHTARRPRPVLSDLAALGRKMPTYGAHRSGQQPSRRKQHAGCIPDRCHVIAVSARAVTAKSSANSADSAPAFRVFALAEFFVPTLPQDPHTCEYPSVQQCITPCSWPAGFVPFPDRQQGWRSECRHPAARADTRKPLHAPFTSCTACKRLAVPCIREGEAASSHWPP